MVLWQADLRVSWFAQWISLLAHGAVALFILLMPWPMGYFFVWIFLLALVVFDSIRSQRRIGARHGEIKLLPGLRVEWQNRQWLILCRPWMLRSGMMLRLRQEGKRRSQHLWLSADSMDAGEWRDLRRLMLLQQVNED